MNSIAAIIVVYNPDLYALMDNVNAIIEDLDYLLLWKNSKCDLSRFSSISDKIIIMGNGENKYLAYPYNIALKWCADKGIKYLLTMDQDSCWVSFNNFVSKVNKIQDRVTAVFAPNINGKINSSSEIIDSNFVISSGSLIDVEAALKVGGFNEQYKIYWVDSEFCHKIKKMGYSIKVISTEILKHKLGTPTKTLFGYETSNYSPQVYYFLIRNMLLEHRQYGAAAVSYKCIMYTYFFNLRGIILGENQKLKKLHKIAVASLHGLFASIK